jgi:hypothetical protein
VLAHYAPLFDGWRAVVERARSRGEVRADIDADAVLLTLTAPFLVVPLLLRRTPTDDEVAQIVDLVLAATSP